MMSVDFPVIVAGVLTTTAAYWLAVAFYTAIPVLFPAHASRYKIQEKNSGLTNAEHARLIALTLFNQVPLTIAVVSGSAAVYFALGGKIALEFPARPEVLWHFVGWLVLFEIGFYASHRLLHTRWLYRHVHLLHHRFKAPVPYSAACVHPVEFVLSYIVPNFGAAMVLHFSYAEILLFLSLEYIHTVHDHSGYFYWWDPFHWLCSQNARMHDEHHRRPTVNFGGAFTSWPDRLFGTYARREGRGRRVACNGPSPHG
jgi:fatty acid hydroxylase domain-containing protein 2